VADAMPMQDDSPAGMVGSAEIDRRMGYHPATAATIPLYEENRARVVALACYWDTHLPAGRELALALTELQSALMWANAAVACNLAPLEDPANRVPNPLVQQMEQDSITQTLRVGIAVRPGMTPEQMAGAVAEEVRWQLHQRSAAEQSAPAVRPVLDAPQA
jgi:hypothetical protein